MEDVDQGFQTCHPMQVSQWLDALFESVDPAPDDGHFFPSSAREKRRLHAPNLHEECGVDERVLANATRTTAARVSVRCGFHVHVTVKQDEHEGAGRGVRRLNYNRRCGRTTAWYQEVGRRHVEAFQQLLPLIAVLGDPCETQTSSHSTQTHEGGAIAKRDQTDDGQVGHDWNVTVASPRGILSGVLAMCVGKPRLHQSTVTLSRLHKRAHRRLPQRCLQQRVAPDGLCVVRRQETAAFSAANVDPASDLSQLSPQTSHHRRLHLRLFSWVHAHFTPNLRWDGTSSALEAQRVQEQELSIWTLRQGDVHVRFQMLDQLNRAVGAEQRERVDAIWEQCVSTCGLPFPDTNLPDSTKNVKRRVESGSLCMVFVKTFEALRKSAASTRTRQLSTTAHKVPGKQNTIALRTRGPSIEPERRNSAWASWNKSREDVASGMSVGLVDAPVVFIVAVRVHVSFCGRAVSDEFS